MSLGTHGAGRRVDLHQGGRHGGGEPLDALAVLAEASQALLTTDIPTALRRVVDALVQHGHATHAVILAHEEPGPRLYFESGQPAGYGTASVPIALDHRTVGSLSADTLPPPRSDTDGLSVLLKALAPIIAHGMGAHRARLLERRQLVEENERLRRRLHEHFDPAGLVAQSEAMRPVADRIAQAVASATPLLLRGEPGSGKELVARTIHQRSAWAERPFVEVAGAALHDASFEADLLGRGGTGAAERKSARAAPLAHGGTLFVDELTDVPPSGQERLLRLLQDTAATAAGADEHRARIRLIVAAADNLEQAVATGTLRGDLYHRLQTHTIVMPPLRDRHADIPVLAAVFLARFAREYSKDVARLSPRVSDLLVRYSWPGNVRELANVMERAVILSEDRVIHGHHLPPAIRTAYGSNAGEFSLSEALDAYEKDLLQDALRTAGGVRSRAARLLKTTERIFNYKVRKHGIDSRHFKP